MGKRFVEKMSKTERHALRLELREAAMKVRSKEIKLEKRALELRNELRSIDAEMQKLARRQDDIRQSLDYLDGFDS